MDEPNADDVYLTNQITIQILLLFKKHRDKEFGTRETQRILNLNSTSTTSFHLNKLADMGLLHKTDANRFYITREGMEFETIKFPFEIPAKYIWGKFVPKYTFLIILIVSSLGFSIIALALRLNYYIEIVAINSSIALIVSGMVIVHEWRYFKRNYEEYTEDT